MGVRTTDAQRLESESKFYQPHLKEHNFMLKLALRSHAATSVEDVILTLWFSSFTKSRFNLQNHANSINP